MDKEFGTNKKCIKTPHQTIINIERLVGFIIFGGVKPNTVFPFK